MNLSHKQAVIARKVKFIFEKGSFISFAFDTHKGKNRKKVPSLFPSKKKKEHHPNLIKSIALFFDKNMGKLTSAMSQEEYDKHFYNFLKKFRSFLIKRRLSNNFSTNNYLFWSYFTKATNILLYDILASNEIVETKKYKPICNFMHVPIDNKVIYAIKTKIHKLNLNDSDKEKIISKLKKYRKLRNINSRKDYIYIQNLIRKVQKSFKEPPIWIEDIYSLT